MQALFMFSKIGGQASLVYSKWHVWLFLCFCALEVILLGIHFQYSKLRTKPLFYVIHGDDICQKSLAKEKWDPRAGSTGLVWFCSSFSATLLSEYLIPMEFSLSVFGREIIRLMSQEYYNDKMEMINMQQLGKDRKVFCIFKISLLSEELMDSASIYWVLLYTKHHSA